MMGREPRASIKHTMWWESASKPTAFFFRPLTLESFSAKDLKFHVTTDNEEEPSDGDVYSFLPSSFWSSAAVSPAGRLRRDCRGESQGDFLLLHW